jgi:poly(3-hydroxybutyrate) depolymerase
MHGWRAILVCIGAFAATPAALAGKCADGTEADARTRAGSDGVCMLIQTVGAEAARPESPLFIVLHGDNGGKQPSGRYPVLTRTIADAFAAPAVYMLRPGYEGEGGKSDGVARALDDDYSKQNVEYMSRALAQLKGLYGSRKVVLVGHSGGSAMAALLLALYPDLVDGVILAGCPCDVQKWRQWRKQSAGKSDGYWPNSLSPSDHVKQVPKTRVVVAVTGDKDTNTLPEFAEAYIGALKSGGVEQAHFVLAPNETHVSVRDSQHLIAAIRLAVEKLQARL